MAGGRGAAARPEPADRDSRKRPRGRPGSPASGRYSVVGLAFVAVIVVALLNLLSDDDAGIVRRARGAAGRLRGPRSSRAARRRCERRPGRLRELAQPMPRGRPPNAGLRDRDRRRDPGLRPLRPAARDLVLVHAAAATAFPARTPSTRSPALRRPRELPHHQRPRRPRRGRRDRPRARLDRPGRAGTATAPSRTSTGSASARRSSLAYPGGILEDGPRSATTPTDAVAELDELTLLAASAEARERDHD